MSLFPPFIPQWTIADPPQIRMEGKNLLFGERKLATILSSGDPKAVAEVPEFLGKSVSFRVALSSMKKVSNSQVRKWFRPNAVYLDYYASEAYIVSLEKGTTLEILPVDGTAFDYDVLGQMALAPEHGVVVYQDQGVRVRIPPFDIVECPSLKSLMLRVPKDLGYISIFQTPRSLEIIVKEIGLPGIEFLTGLRAMEAMKAAVMVPGLGGAIVRWHPAYIVVHRGGLVNGLEQAGGPSPCILLSAKGESSQLTDVRTMGAVPASCVLKMIYGGALQVSLMPRHQVASRRPVDISFDLSGRQMIINFDNAITGNTIDILSLFVLNFLMYCSSGSGDFFRHSSSIKMIERILPSGGADELRNFCSRNKFPTSRYQLGVNAVYAIAMGASSTPFTAVDDAMVLWPGVRAEQGVQ